MAHHHHHHHTDPEPDSLCPPYCCGNEAWAVVAEALALEQETRAETAQFAEYVAGFRPPLGPKATLDSMRESAERLAAQAWSIQYPPANPYATIGAGILPLATSIIELVNATPAEPIAPGDESEPRS